MGRDETTGRSIDLDDSAVGSGSGFRSGSPSSSLTNE
jgi:hypothetical protein